MRPAWKKGVPWTIGRWVVKYKNGDYVVAEVEDDRHEETGRLYLRVYVDGFSESMEDATSDILRFAEWSYGPIPECPKKEGKIR